MSNKSIVLIYKVMNLDHIANKFSLLGDLNKSLLGSQDIIQEFVLLFVSFFQSVVPILVQIDS